MSKEEVKTLFDAATRLDGYPSAFGAKDPMFHAIQAAALARVLKLACLHVQAQDGHASGEDLDAFLSVATSIEGHALRTVATINERAEGDFNAIMERLAPPKEKSGGEEAGTIMEDATQSA